MDKAKIIVESNIEKQVCGLYYIYNNKYYFIYTEKELDENGYVVLYLVQVGKEVINNPTGIADTGYMIGLEIADETEWVIVENSITKIVEDKKNGTVNPEIMYLPINSLGKLKIVSKKRFRLLKSIIENDFKVTIDTQGSVAPMEIPPAPNNLAPLSDIQPLSPISTVSQPANIQINSDVKNSEIQTPQDVVVIDYRTSFFEEQEKNKELQAKVEELTQKLENVKKAIE